VSLRAAGGPPRGRGLTNLSARPAARRAPKRNRDAYLLVGRATKEGPEKDSRPSGVFSCPYRSARHTRWSRASCPAPLKSGTLPPSRGCEGVRVPGLRIDAASCGSHREAGHASRRRRPACYLCGDPDGGWVCYCGPPGRGDCAASAASCRLAFVRDGAIGSRASLPGSLPIGQGTTRVRM